MDRVKVVLEMIKKHHFWVLCGVIVILGLVFWWSATAGLADRIETRTGEIEGKKTQVASISSEGKHPNERVISAIAGRQEELRKKVFDAWSTLYRDQKDRNQWPAQLGDNFRRYMEALGPEDEIPWEMRDTYMYFIKNHFPEMYEIVDILLAQARDEKGKPKKDEKGKPVKIDPFEAKGSRDYGMGMDAGGPGMYDGGMPGGGGVTRTSGSQGTEIVGKVDWNMADLKRIRDAFYWTTRPTSIQVRLAQEDLWVYEALLRVIQRTNEGATNPYTAAVKRIDALEIGQRAAGAFARLRPRSAQSGGAGGYTSGAGPAPFGGASSPDGPMPYESMPTGPMPDMPGMPGMPGMPDMPGMPGAMPGMPGMPGPMPGEMAGPGFEYSGAGGGMPGPGMGGMPGPGMGLMTGSGAAVAVSLEEQIKYRLIHGRYVDQDGMPLAATQPRPFAEFRMMPVRMFLLVDQRRISRLLVNCANSSMPVEVCRVSLSPGKGKPLDFGRMGTSAGPGPQGGPMSAMPGEMMSPSYGPGMEDAGPGPGGYSTDGMAMGRGQSKQTSYDVPVEIHAIIYIFNPPDIEKLGTGAATEEPGAAPGPAPIAPRAGAPATPPAAGPAAPPAAAPATPPARAPAGGPMTPATPATPPVAGAANP